MRLPLLISLWALVGFSQNRPNQLMFLPLIPHIERSFSGQTLRPEFIVFADKFTATALDGWPRTASPRVAAPGSKIVCPWSKAQGIRGYAVQVALDSLRDRSAVARYEISCSESIRSGGFAAGEVLQLQLRNGQWYVVKVLDRRLT